MSLALELWRALEAWDPDRHPRGPGGRFIKLGGGGHHDKPSLADVIRGTAVEGPKRQRKDKGGMSVADAVRQAARRSDTTGRPTQRSADEHRAHGAHDVADEVDRALAEAGVSEEARAAVSGRARARAETHGPRPETLPRAGVLSTDVTTSGDDIANRYGKTAAAIAEKRAAAPADHEAAVRSAYDDLSPGPGEWVSIADLRERMGGTRAEQDTAIRSLIHQPGWQIEEETNQKTLRPRDREGAIRIGGRDQHVIAYAKPVAAPARTAARARREFSAADAASVGAKLETAKTRDEAQAHLADLTTPQLRQVAGLMGVSVRSGDTKPKVANAIVEGTAGRRLDSKAIGKLGRVAT